MTNLELTLIPEEKKSAVLRGVRETFSATEIDDIQKMTRGLSSDLVFRIAVNRSPFLLRIMTRIDERNDPVRHFACMRSAAEAGLAPRVWYVNETDGISITDFIGTVPFPEPEALVRIPPTLRRLHALPLFPKAFNYVTAHKGFIWRFRTANLLPVSDVEEIFPRYEEICRIYPRLDADMVSCHSDLKPENILFDGERVWLIDWQAGFVNDRYFDLAVVANFLLRDAADEGMFLAGYFGQSPDEYQLARFFLMRQALHLFYATVFFLLGAGGNPVNQNDQPPSFRDFHQRIWAGKVDLADNQNKIAYAWVHWRQLLQNIRQDRFEDSLRIVADRHNGDAGVLPLLPVAP